MINVACDENEVFNFGLQVGSVVDFSKGEIKKFEIKIDGVKIGGDEEPAQLPYFCIGDSVKVLLYNLFSYRTEEGGAKHASPMQTLIPNFNTMTKKQLQTALRGLKSMEITNIYNVGNTKKYYIFERINALCIIHKNQSTFNKKPPKNKISTVYF